MTLEQIFEKCQKLSVGKRQDYTTGQNRSENFHRSAEIISWFKHDRDKPYAALIGTKLARLGSLLSKNSKPNNESIEDNFADIINYFALWLEDITENKELHSFVNTPIQVTIIDHNFKASESTDGPSFCGICRQHCSRHEDWRKENIIAKTT